MKSFLVTSTFEQWRNRWRGNRGQSAPPPETSDREISADVPGKKKRQGKMEQKRRKIIKGKVENWKLQKEERIFFFFFFFFFFFSFLLFKTTEICFGSTKMGIFYREKSISYRGKNQEK